MNVFYSFGKFQRSERIRLKVHLGASKWHGDEGSGPHMADCGFSPEAGGLKKIMPGMCMCAQNPEKGVEEMGSLVVIPSENDFTPPLSPFVYGEHMCLITKLRQNKTKPSVSGSEQKFIYVIPFNKVFFQLIDLRD